MYGMVAVPCQRILTLVNAPRNATNEDMKRSRRFFWFNSTTYAPYDPSDTTRMMCSGIHILLDADEIVARLTGRTRTKESNDPDDKGKERECREIEILIPESGLLRQCYYYLAWEAEGLMQRWAYYGDSPDVHIFWAVFLLKYLLILYYYSARH